jgi:hypothetical protein
MGNSAKSLFCSVNYVFRIPKFWVLRVPPIQIPTHTVVIIAPYFVIFEPDRLSRDAASISVWFSTCTIFRLFSCLHEKYFYYFCNYVIMQRKSRNSTSYISARLVWSRLYFLSRLSRLPWRRQTGLGFDPMILNLSLGPASKTTAPLSHENLWRKTLISLSSELRAKFHDEK